MADYTIVSDISTYIKRLLAEALYPNFISSEEALSITSPSEKNADYQIGIYLYDIQGMGEYSMPQMVSKGLQRRQYPPKSLKLKYMIYLNSKAQVATKGEDAQKILGMIMQIFYDHSQVDIKEIHGLSSEIDDLASLSILNMTIEEKAKIWTALTLPMQLAVYLEVSPILLESKREMISSRVVDMNIETRQKGGD